MKGSRSLIRTVLVTGAAAALTIGLAPAASAQPDYEVVASGLDNPRHLQFDDDGVLYVAESGSGGDQACGPGPEGAEVCYGTTGAITAVDDGEQERVVDGLPSAAEAGGGSATGPSDVAPSGDDLLVTVGLGGDPASRDALPAEFADLGWLLRADPDDGTTEQFADIAGFEGESNPDGTEPPDSNPNAVIARGGGAVVVDAGGNSLLRVSGSGEVETIATFPGRDQPVGIQLPDGPPPGTLIPSQAVPTSVSARGGSLFVGELTGFPFAKGGAQVYRVRDGETEVRATGLTNVMDVEAGPDGSLYVVELATEGLLASPPGSVPSGRLLSVARDGTVEVVADDLPAPGGVAVRDGTAYVTTNSVLAGAGEVIAIPLD